jgi:Ca-activated chloride channel family protein
MIKMYRLIRSKPVFALTILTLSLLVAACSPSAEKLNKDGNSAYAREAYEEALSAYQFAQIESPELAEPYYNAANSLYRQGMYVEALEQISQALSFAKEETLAENSYYNLGNSSFSTQEWENSIEAYTEALLLNPDDLDAKYNLELALQQMQQQEQQEEQEQDQEQNQDQEQSQDSEDGENKNKDQDQDQSQSEGDQGEQEQDSQSADQGENQDDQSENDENQEDGSAQDNAEQNQDQNGEQGQPQDNDAQNQEQPSQSGQVPAPGQRMTEEQAKQLLAALAQDMQTLQERLGQILFVRKPPPIQDW